MACQVAEHDHRLRTLPEQRDSLATVGRPPVERPVTEVQQAYGVLAIECPVMTVATIQTVSCE
jgi:hypothetical protein